MIQSKDEFARIWKKEPSELTQLDNFIFLLINKVHSKLEKEFFQELENNAYKLDAEQLNELTVQLGDGLHFFYEQICFGKGCSLGCPNKLDLAFSKKEEDTQLQIIKQEFDGNAAACKSRKECLQQDLMNYVIKDNLIDFYSYTIDLECSEEEPQIMHLANFILPIIMRFTMEHGSSYLKEPFQKIA